MNGEYGIDWFWVAVMVLCVISFLVDRYAREC